MPALMAGAFVFTLLFSKRLGVAGHWAGLTAITICLGLSIVAGIQWNNTERIPLKEAEKAELAAIGLEAHESETTSEKSDDNEIALGATVGKSVAAPVLAASSTEEELVRVPVLREWSWFDMGDGGQEGDSTVQIGTRADGLSIVMLLTVCLISFMVHIFSIGYLKGDRRYRHYFASLALFTGAMMLMVISSTTLGVLFGWELMGLCSFLLIGHWWEDRNNANAALKAFFTTRTGDIGLLVGIAMLFFFAGNRFDIAAINYTAIEGGRTTMLTVACAALLVAVIGKSAQFPLHTWLPDAMAGPTPASALIHAATMVVAGVYLVLRLYPSFWTAFDIGGGVWSPIAIVGVTTAITAALLAFVQTDLKKVLAYSTVSQLGFMVLALGVGGWIAALFHLVTHAVFKGLLFLCAGSVSEGCHHTFDMREMGGLRKKMPVTYATFMIGTLALCGVAPFAGFFSKDEILLSAGTYGYKTFMYLGFLAAALTAMYMTRATYLTFFGRYRGHAHPHESPRILTLPLISLTAISIPVGLINLPLLGHPLDKFAATATNLVLYEEAGLPSILTFSWNKAIASVLVVAFAFALAYAYNVRKMFGHGLTKRSTLARAGYTFLVNKYYLDRLYTDGVVGGIKGPVANAAYWVNQNVIDGVVNGVGTGGKLAAKGVYNVLDQSVVDGAVNGVGAAATQSGGLLRKLQNGQVQTYAAWLFGAGALFVLYLAINA